MTRVAVGSIMAALGYLLVFAAVDGKGQYALSPWKALDA